jgi:hypothetical protein
MGFNRRFLRQTPQEFQIWFGRQISIGIGEQTLSSKAKEKYLRV